ncbi:MAG: AAA family ATPase [Candidatus Diapherotrites archaeon]|nr:AAA family ATPase [Candidatus Diapherotrites archaeon]
MNAEKLSPLGEEESLFSNPEALDTDFIPPLMPFRESEIKEIAASISQLLEGKSGRNLLITGKTGIGKTHAVKKVLSDFSEESNAFVFYVNCWTHPTGREVFEEICSQLKIQKPADASDSVLLGKIIERTGSTSVAVCFDEIDRAKEQGFLYSALEEFKVKSIMLISNRGGFLATLDERIKSRLLAKEIAFRQYSRDEMDGIVRERRKYAFYEDAWEKKALDLVAEKAFEKGDVRFAVQLLKLAGLKAEEDASRIVKAEHVEKALEEVAL